ncbi:hypothetical protein FHS63_006261, partial [Azospirillum doebereinerae]
VAPALNQRVESEAVLIYNPSEVMFAAADG